MTVSRHPSAARTARRLRRLTQERFYLTRTTSAYRNLLRKPFQLERRTISVVFAIVCMHGCSDNVGGVCAGWGNRTELGSRNSLPYILSARSIADNLESIVRAYWFGKLYNLNADVSIVYAHSQPVLVVDAHAPRICIRIGPRRRIFGITSRVRFGGDGLRLSDKSPALAGQWAGAAPAFVSGGRPSDVR
ncbi:hypothetical protein EVAR_3677_1 [Eumeta japonica]|uniref:Uncharacterized protein n=1 Tax=Eumeta variegata TaxID=151549 RepID=A0A4C1STT2_EUMVA|nr:hypothetical protein EVAR_3677_1 [Eumeta japonica]